MKNETVYREAEIVKGRMKVPERVGTNGQRGTGEPPTRKVSTNRYPAVFPLQQQVGRWHSTASSQSTIFRESEEREKNVSHVRIERSEEEASDDSHRGFARALQKTRFVVVLEDTP
jgi:hypothetical protein